MRLRRSLLLAPLACAALLVPAKAGALSLERYPYVQDGPVIVGVTSSDAWITWYTAHHEGKSASLNQCSLDAQVSDAANIDIPTVKLNTGAEFTDDSCDRYHRVHVTGLQPSTTYRFGLDKPWDKRGGPAALGSFTTAPAPGSKAGFKFVVYGDTRNHVFLQGQDTRADHQAVVDAILAHEGDAAFLLHTGDLALNVSLISGDDNGYTEFFAVERQLLAQKPLYVVLGNHETIDSSFFDGLLDPARYRGQPHPYYSSFDWGPVHMAMVDAFEGSHLPEVGNSARISPAQVQWLDADLQHAQATGQLSFVGVHQGAYSHAKTSTGHGGLAVVATNVVPLMLKYGALASFAGHDHYYQRGHEGCIDYLVVGGGGATQYEPDPSAAGVAVALQKTSYVSVTVTADGQATAVAKDVNGAAIDTFTFVTPPTTCSGTGTDGGTPADGGSVDGGNDAGVDAGIDAGTGADAGNPLDAGNPADSGPASDGGSDAGNGGGVTGSTGCTSSGPAALQVGLFFGALALLRRRRPPPR